MHIATRHLVPLVSAILIVLTAAACSSGEDATGKKQSPAGDEPRLASLAPQDVLSLSSERSLEVETFSGTFDMKVSSGGFSINMAGDYVFRAPDTMYMTMEMFGQSMKMLMVLPDFYIEVPGEGWFVVNGEAAGIDWDVFEQYVEQRGPMDYSAITEQLEGLEQLPDDTIDGVTYLHYGGALDFAKLMGEVPEGMIDPAVLDQVSGSLDQVHVELWLDRENYLPYRADMSMDFSAGAEMPSFSMEMSMLSFDYNEPVDIPEPPADARSIDELSS